ncbi:hypothetical protein [Blastococcus sp. TF02A-35]|uniref:hypothetical protein n=1 Tax=Blastococcus sp. TF02A-35 TaxID=2559612 RepID=UPI0010730F27|nr:hypothetical protein [Blastococcus sp. TF02A_35]TFV52713.1 hypothetical protein E4P43_05285 [Blastococcus sp. TF02A_35]
MSAPQLDPQERARLETWYRSLSGRHGRKLHAAVGHEIFRGPAPRLGRALMWAGVVLGVAGAVVLGAAGLERGAVLYLLPFVGLAALGSYLSYGLDPGYVLTDELLVALWEADQRLSSRGR